MKGGVRRFGFKGRGLKLRGGGGIGFGLNGRDGLAF